MSLDKKHTIDKRKKTRKNQKPYGLPHAAASGFSISMASELSLLSAAFGFGFSEPACCSGAGECGASGGVAAFGGAGFGFDIIGLHAL